MPIDLWLSLLCAVVFAVGALMIKRSNQLGVRPWPTTLVSNLTTAAGLMLVWPLGGQIPAWTQWWQPALVAVLFIGGQALAFLAFHRGDVSVATPVLGVKIVLVAVATTLIVGDRLGWQLWTGAALSTLALVALNRTDRGSARRVGQTVLFAGGCALCFALFDVLVRKWASGWGAGRFLPIMMLMVAGMSLAAHPVLHRGPLGIRPPAGRWLWSGAALIGLQSTVFVTTIAVFKNVAAENVVFSSRGLWSVALVWLVGHWFHSQEKTLGGKVLAWRLTGAALMTAAIGVVVLG